MDIRPITLFFSDKVMPAPPYITSRVFTPFACKMI